MAGLVSRLAEVVSNMKNPIKSQGLENELLKKGVKPLEIERSEILKAAPDESGSIQPIDLQEQEKIRPDLGTVNERISRSVSPEQSRTAMNTGLAASWDQYTVPGTNLETYRERVYRNSATGPKGSSHFPEADYEFHTRSDIYEEAGDISMQTKAENVTPTYGDRALRIQEIQSDVHNKQIADIKKGEVDYTAPIEVISQHVATTPPNLNVRGIVEGVGVGEDLVPYIANTYSVSKDTAEDLAKKIRANPEAGTLRLTPTQRANEAIGTLKDAYGVNESTAVRIYDDYLNGSMERIDVSNKVDFESLDIEETMAEAINWDKSNGVILSDTADELDAVFRYLTEEKGLSTTQRNTIYEQIQQQQLGNVIADRAYLAGEQSKVTPFKVPYIKQALSHEFDRAQQEGLREVQIAINPEGVDSLVRAEGVQRNYETTVRRTAEKLAKSIGAETKMDKGWLVIGLPAAGFTLPLYAEEDGVDVQEDKDGSYLNTMQLQGVEPAEAHESLFRFKAEAAGMPEEEILSLLEQQQRADPEAEFINRAMDLGYSQQEAEFQLGHERLQAQKILDDQNALTDPMGPRRPGESMGDYTYRVKAEFSTEYGWPYRGVDGPADMAALANQFDQQQYREVERLISNIKETMQVTDPVNEIKAAFGSPTAKANLEVMELGMAEYIQPYLASKDIPLRYEQDEDGYVHYYTQDSKGDEIEVTPGLMQDLWGDKFEISGDTTGFIMGAGAAISYFTPQGRFAKYAVGLSGGAGGALIGSFIGTELDYINAAMQSHQEISAQQAMVKALGAAEASIFWGLLGEGGSLFVKGGVHGFKWAGKMAKFIDNGNREGATTFTMETLGRTREESEELVSLWEQVNDKSAPGLNTDEKILAILPTTEAGGEDILAAATQLNPRASGAVLREVRARADTLLAEATQEGSLSAAHEVLAGLRKIKDETGRFLEEAKAPFYNVDIKLAEPIDVADEISVAYDTIVLTGLPSASFDWLQEFAMKSEHLARGVATGEDLLELRKTMTGLKNSSDIRNKKALESLDVVIAKITAKIEEVAKLNMGDEAAEEWLDQWNTANRAYSEMLSVESNALFNSILKFDTSDSKAITPQNVANAFIKYGPSIDDAFIRKGGVAQNTYTQVIEHMTPDLVRKTEGLIVQGLTEKYTIGNLGGIRATQFPELAREMALYSFQTPDARRLQTVVDKLATLYKNDVSISTVSGQISPQQFQSYLTTNPIVRAKFAIASGIFNYASTLKGGPRADASAMIKKVGNLLEEPLNAKTTTHVIEMVKEDQTLVKAIENYQAEYARGVSEGTITPSVKVRTYKDRSGQIWTKPGRGRTPQTETARGQSVAMEAYVIEKFGSTSELSKLHKAELINDGFEYIALESGRLMRLF